MSTKSTGVFSNMLKNVWKSVTGSQPLSICETNDNSSDQREKKSEDVETKVLEEISIDFEEDKSFSNLKLVFLEDFERVNYEKLTDILNEAEITLEHILKSRKLSSWSDSMCAQDNLSLSSQSTAPSLSEECSKDTECCFESEEDLDLSDCDSEDGYAVEK